MSEHPIFRKVFGALRPVNDPAKALMEKLKLDALVVCEVRRPRNLDHHRKWWALMNVIAENVPHMTPDLLCEIIKIRIGHVDVWGSPKGDVLIPKSISFSSMDQTAFEAFYDRAVRFIQEEIIPGLDSDQLAAEVNAILEGRQK